MKRDRLLNLGMIALTTALMGQSADLTAQTWKEKDADYFPRHEITVNYGTPTILELTTTLGKPMMTGAAEGKSANHMFTGAAGIGYQFSPHPLFSIGIAGGISHAAADIVLTSDLPQLKANTKLYNSALTTYTAQVHAQWTYLENGMLSISCGLYAGAAYMDETVKKYLDSPEMYNVVKYPKDRMKFAYHLTAIKARYGEVFGIFGELGFGYRGLVNIGLSVRL